MPRLFRRNRLGRLAIGAGMAVVALGGGGVLAPGGLSGPGTTGAVYSASLPAGSASLPSVCW